MALDYETDLNVSLDIDTKYQSLYQWCLKETKQNGDQVGRDLIPFGWNVSFHAISFGIQKHISSDSIIRLDENEEIGNLKFVENDSIFGKLKTGYFDGVDWQSSPSISMIGSSRTVEDIDLKIRPTDDLDGETCRVWGTVAYEFELDFRNERTEDTIQISFYLERKKFNSLFDLVRKNEIDRISLRLSGIEGFYSDWSPSISTDAIKVLANMEDQGLQVDANWSKLIPTLGRVGEASIAVQRIQTAKHEEPSLSDMDQDEQHDLYENALIQSHRTPDNSQDDIRHSFTERSLSRIAKLIGILIVIEILRAVF